MTMSPWGPHPQGLKSQTMSQVVETGGVPVEIRTSLDRGVAEYQWKMHGFAPMVAAVRQS